MKITSRSLSTVPTLYRRLLKTIIKKFDTDHELIIRAWKTTKAEFLRSGYEKDKKKLEALKQKAIGVERTIRQGIIPIYQSRKDKQRQYHKVDHEILKGSDNHVEPVDGQSFVTKFKDYIKDDDHTAVEQMLRSVGRWNENVHIENTNSSSKSNASAESNGREKSAPHKDFTKIKSRRWVKTI